MNRIDGYKHLFALVIDAYKGMRLFSKLDKKYRIRSENHYLILLSTKNAAYNYYFLKGITECFEPQKKVIVMTLDSRIDKVAPFFEKRNEIITIKTSQKEIEQLIHYYCMLDFYWRFRLIDLDRPLDRKCSHLIGEKGITAEQLIVCGIMNCSYERFKARVHRKVIPEYHGSDKRIKSFFAEVKKYEKRDNGR